MGQFEQIQTRKAISAYGGVGSIIETRDGSILIRPFNEWPFFQALNGNFEEHNLITDKRFKNRISKYFQQLEQLVRIPTNDFKQGFKLENPIALLSAKYFPEWFYCNTCHKFDKFDNWKYNWENNVVNEDKEKFYPPKCFHCYIKNHCCPVKPELFFNVTLTGNLLPVFLCFSKVSPLYREKRLLRVGLPAFLTFFFFSNFLSPSFFRVFKECIHVNITHQLISYDSHHV